MNSAFRILAVDDEPQIQRFLKPSLTAAGYDVALASTGAQALRLFETLEPAIIILDLGLPDIDGKEVIRRVREMSDVPIIVLSARDREAEKIAALDLGADDYVNKPFGIGELLARIRAVTRQKRSSAPEATAFSLGNVHIDALAHRVVRHGETLRLTPKEFELLVSLARHAGRVMTHRQILSTVWGPAHASDTQYLRVFIGQLRQKLEEDPSNPRLILTEPGIGYRVADSD
jgi:two-component system KDP operon response regulator KdpE